MAGSTRIKGKQLSLLLGTPPVDVFADATDVRFENDDADSDTVTFADAAAGDTKDYFLRGSGIQSTDTDSFWRMCWDQSGQDIAFTYAVHGNATPTAAQPHITGIVTVGAKPILGGEAGKDNTFTFEFEWKVVSFTLDTGD